MQSRIWILGHAVICTSRDFGKRVFVDYALPMTQCISLIPTRFSVVNWRLKFIFRKTSLKWQEYDKIILFVTYILLVPFWFGIWALERRSLGVWAI